MKIAESIMNQQDRDGMLRRSMETIIQLYTDRSHFIYELLQNAEDAGASSIRFIQYEDHLEVLHDGHPFTRENLQSLCDVRRSDKTEDLNKIGEFGVGFKSVFAICDTVRLYNKPHSDNDRQLYQPFSVEIQDFTKLVDIEPETIAFPYTTRFVFPYCVGESFSGFKTIDDLNNTLSKRLKNLGYTTLLFMRHLDAICYEINIPGMESSGEYSLHKERISDRCTRVAATDTADNGLSFFKFSMPIDTDISSRTLDIAFSFRKDKNGRILFERAENPYISVYFPTETESKLGFIVQGPFRTTPNRGSVPADDEENMMLAQRTAELFRLSLLELRDMKLLNLSLMRILPLDPSIFYVYPLFQPLYEEMLSLFSNDMVIPALKDGVYTDAAHALITRSRELVELLPEKLISELYIDGKKRVWLSTLLTETGPYREVLAYFTNRLRIPVIQPSDLRSLINSNPSFLKKREDAWLVRMYHMFENMPRLFSENNPGNILDAVIVKTKSGQFVAPYTKINASAYQPNVYILPKGEYNVELEFVHPWLYAQCKTFFDKVLHLEAPDKFEYFIEKLKKRYNSPDVVIETEWNIKDLQTSLDYLDDKDHMYRMKAVLQEVYILSCFRDGKPIQARPFQQRILFPQTESGLMLEEYYKGIDRDILFVDYGLYKDAGFSYSDFHKLNVTDDICTGTQRTRGKAQIPFMIDKIEKALFYISLNGGAKDAMIKSQVIFKLLQKYETLLTASSDIIQILCGHEDIFMGGSVWNGKWLYTEPGQLVASSEINKYDLSTALYGKVNPESTLYELLGFQKGQEEIRSALVKDYETLSQEQKQLYFELELEHRFGITPEQLQRTICNTSGDSTSSLSSTVGTISFTEESYEFPTGMVKNWEALRKHAMEMLSYANPVRYESVIRRVRSSKNSSDARYYLMNMYRINASNRFACQLCHEASSSFEAVQIETKPDVELDPLYLCLCPNCAARFRSLRNDRYRGGQLLNRLIALTQDDVSSKDHVSIMIGDYDFWFTPVHVAEIMELLKLKEQVKAENPSEWNNIDTSAERPDIQSGSKSGQAKSSATSQKRKTASTYENFVGKRVYHKGLHSYAQVITCNAKRTVLRFESGDRAGDYITFDSETIITSKMIKIEKS